MLCELRINNLALISSLELCFDETEVNGLVVMTGETGAGKSIMLQALHLLSGGRGSGDWIRNGADNCTIEALFEIKPENKLLLQQLADSGFGDEPTVIIKRVIGKNGRSKLYVNGSLATAKRVAEITSAMLNVASQHDHQQLLQPAMHLDFLDSFGELWALRHQHEELYALWQSKRKELVELRQQNQDKEQRQDFLQYQLNEIEEAALYENEDEELAAEKKRLKSADTLIKLSQESYYLLSGEISERLSLLRKNIEQLLALDPDFEKLGDEINGFAFSAEDYAQELRQYRDGLENDPYRLDQVSERLDLIHTLKRKYGESITTVLGYAENARAELVQIESLDNQLDELDQEVASLWQQLCEVAEGLSSKRKKAAATLELGMARELRSLAFGETGFSVIWNDTNQIQENLRPTGWDRVEFFFSANLGEELRPLAKVASGGELSRLMLAMKCLLAKRDMVDTVIFDEVDAGIGGEAAEAVARKIQELATHHQVFCITHLPQIAARGTMHFQVSKMTEDGRTQSSVKRLSSEHRVQELARMLAGDSVTEQTEAWARELLLKGCVVEVD